MRTITARQVRAWLPPRKKEAHKGTSGRVFIIAGSRGMAGAAVLSASAAARSGAGLVRLAIVKSQQEAVVKKSPPEITTLGLKEDASGRMAGTVWAALKKGIEQFQPDVIAFGPGVRLGPAITKIISGLLKTFSGGLVVDADGLNTIAQMKKLPTFRGALILTPHAGEMSRLLRRPVSTNPLMRIESVIRAARRFKAVSLLKGPGTLVSDGRVVWRNTTGNPAMASGGMGDVLTGMIAALWAQMGRPTKESALKAAATAAFLHGRAADEALRRIPEKTMLASDVINALPAAFKKTFGGKK